MKGEIEVESPLVPPPFHSTPPDPASPILAIRPLPQSPSLTELPYPPPPATRPAPACCDLELWGSNGVWSDFIKTTTMHENGHTPNPPPNSLPAAPHHPTSKPHPSNLPPPNPTHHPPKPSPPTPLSPSATPHLLRYPPTPPLSPTPSATVPPTPTYLTVPSFSTRR